MEESRMTRISAGLKKLEKLKSREVTIPRIGSWPETKHYFEEKTVNALKAALAAERPLLIRGEPGIGKSQLARAAAFALKRSFLYEVIHSQSERQDLLFSYDAVERLAEAQIIKASDQNVTPELARGRLDHKNFLCPGPVWWTLNHESAARQFKECYKTEFKPEVMKGCSFENGAVLLLDEIDKADSELPNGLLETLGNGSFTVPYLNNQSIESLPHLPPPLVIITTNEERELPSAFMRRCLVLHLKLKTGADLEEWLIGRGKVHFKSQCFPDVMRRAARQLIKDREIARSNGLPAPGQAEYLDLLRILTRIGNMEKDQEKWLQEIDRYVLEKNVLD